MAEQHRIDGCGGMLHKGCSRCPYYDECKQEQYDRIREYRKEVKGRNADEIFFSPADSKRRVEMGHSVDPKYVPEPEAVKNTKWKRAVQIQLNKTEKKIKE